MMLLPVLTSVHSVHLLYAIIRDGLRHRPATTMALFCASPPASHGYPAIRGIVQYSYLYSTFNMNMSHNILGKQVGLIGYGLMGNTLLT